MTDTGKKSLPLAALAPTLQLDGSAIPALMSLPAARQQLLVKAVHGVQSAQREALSAAIENALSHIPLLLRRPVLKILRS